MSLRFGRSARRGVTTVEWFCILGFGTLVLLASVSSLGGIAKLGLEDNAKQWGDPSQTVAETTSTPSGSESDSKSKSKGNNGVGNGSEDGPPPGNAPENDGEGTGPGNPGNKGGAKKK